MNTKYLSLALVSGFALGTAAAFAAAPASLPAIAIQVKQPDIRQRVAAAQALYKSGNLSGALAAFESLEKEDAKSSDIQAWLGFLYLQSKRPQEAIPHLKAAAAARPQDLEVNNNLGSAYYEAGDADKALAQYLLVEKMDGKLPQTPYNIGVLYLGKKDYQSAISAFKRALHLAPSDPFAHNNLGIAYEGLGDLPAAAKAYQAAHALAPDNLTFTRNAGLALYAHHDYLQAAPFLAALTGSNVDPNVLLSLADCYTQIKDWPKALEIYQQLEPSQSAKSSYWFNLGVVRQHANDEVGAEAAYRKCLTIDSNDLDALTNLAMMLYRHQAYGEAETLFDKLAGLNSSSLSAKQNLAAAATRAGDYPKAIATWKDVLHMDPGDNDSRLQLANLLWQEGRYEDSRYHFSQVLLQNPGNAVALNGIGLYQLHNTKLSDAAASFRSCIHAKPSYVPAYNNLALTLEKMNRRAQAIALLERAHNIDPTDSSVNRNLKRMKAAK